MFRREWRRHALVLGLLVVAIAATIVGLGVVTNATDLKASPTLGTANTLLDLPGTDRQPAADIAAIQRRFAPVDVIEHQRLPVPGSVSTVDLRAESPNAPFGAVTLRLMTGRFPAGAGEVAVTKGVAQDFGLRTGSTWDASGRALRVVGTVENPLDLTDQFALVAPGQANPPSDVSVLLNASEQELQSFRLPSGTGLLTGSRGTTGKATVAGLVLVLASLGLVFVGLLAVAGFTVMAQRRLRALGMLRALGATDRHIRRVMLADGAAVGATAAVLGTAVGLVAWLAFVPTLQSTAGHVVDPFALPWWAVAAAIVLTVTTAVLAAWWPARAVARVSAVAALSGRPPRPLPAHRPAALGSLLLAAGLGLLAFAQQRHGPFIIGGILATVVGVLLLAPLAIRVFARVARRAPIAVRLALRDLVRYQARSGAALGAVTLAIAIAATIAISAAAAEAPPSRPNLPRNELVLHVAPLGAGTQVPSLTTLQLEATAARVADLAAALHARSVVTMEQAYTSSEPLQAAETGPGPTEPAGHGVVELDKVVPHPGGGIEVSFVQPLYVATPAVLAHYHLGPSQISPAADLITTRTNLRGLRVFAPGSPIATAPAAESTGAAPVGTRGSGSAPSGSAPSSSPPGLPAPSLQRPPGLAHPVIQVLAHLPMGTSEPSALLTPHAMQELGLAPIPSAWLVDAGTPLTAAQIRQARTAAAAAGLYVETTTVQKSLAPLRNWSTAAGALVALGVLGMTVGLIRSETANDLRTLTAAGASSTTRRTLTGATSGALALMGAVLGTAGAYAALLAWYRSDLHPLGHVPVVDLIAIVAGFPIVAGLAGWLLAGSRAPALARRPLE
jgi:putative ABC transport system permease protein